MQEPIKRAHLDRRLAFSWPGAFENWSRAWVRRHFWRVRHVFGTEEDAVQECGLIFARCLHYYADKVNNPAWMMALYKQAVFHDWCTYAIMDKRQRGVQGPDVSADHPDFVPRLDYNAGPLAVALAGASAELRTAMGLIVDAPAELLDIIFASRSKDDINRRLRRMCGIKGKPDLMGELRALLA